jgi:hypothetical protein
MLRSMGSIDEILATIRRLPLTERLALIERAAREAAEDTPKPGAVAAAQPSLIGLMADEPELVDQMCAMVYQARSTARMRTIDE